MTSPWCGLQISLYDAFLPNSFHYSRHGVSHDRYICCLFNRLFKLTSKETSKLCITVHLTDLSVTGIPSQINNNAESLSIWGHHNEWILGTVMIWLRCLDMQHDESPWWILNMKSAFNEFGVSYMKWIRKFLHYDSGCQKQKESIMEIAIDYFVVNILPDICLWMLH